MKKIYYLLAILISLTMIVSACAAPTTEPTSKPVEEQPAEEVVDEEMAPEEEPCVLHMQGSARNKPGEEEAWAEVIAAFEQEYNCEVSVRWTGEWSEIPQQLETARMASEPVDISTAGAMLVNSTLARGGILMDITDLITPFEDRFAPGMLKPYIIGDRVWGIPWGTASSSMFYYNKTLFDELGLEEPKTYEDLLAIHQAVQENTDMMTMVHQGKAPWMWPMWFFETFAQTTGNTSVEFIIEFLSGNKSFDDPDAIAVPASDDHPALTNRELQDLHTQQKHKVKMMLNSSGEIVKPPEDGRPVDKKTSVASP